jgi:hypothetical protein
MAEAEEGASLWKFTAGNSAKLGCEKKCSRPKEDLGEIDLISV